jgi:H+/Cl- antiporter ClcA
MESIDITDSQFSLVNKITSLSEFVPEIIDNIENIENIENAVSSISSSVPSLLDSHMFKEDGSLGFASASATTVPAYSEISEISDNNYSSLFFYIGLGIICIIIGIFIYNYYKNKNKNSKNVTFQNVNNLKQTDERERPNYMQSDY